MAGQDGKARQEDKWPLEMKIAVASAYAHEAMLAALIMAHPKPQEVLLYFHTLSEAQIASALSRRSDEEYVQALLAAVRRLREITEDAVRQEAEARQTRSAGA